MKKVKVTKKTRAKTPWYERPPLLFGAIAIVLLLGGILMAQLQSRNANQTALGTVPDSLASPAGAPQSAGPAGSSGEDRGDGSADRAQYLLDPADPLPEPVTGQMLPPLRAETLPDAVAAREKLREARGLTVVDQAGPLDPGHFGYADLGAWPADEAAASVAWGEFAAAPEPGYEGIELHRDLQGGFYVMGFVGEEVAGALGEQAPSLELAPMPEEARIPKWQFWRKAPKPERLVLYQGSDVTVYPDVQPEATCAVALPAEHIAVARAVERSIPGAHPIKVLEIALQ